jgi:hypothetical protein
MPIVVSLFGVGLFSILALIGGAMLFSRATAPIGKRILIYSFCSFLVGVVCCWIGYALMLFIWLPLSHWLGLRTVLIDPPLAIFWVSGPFGIVLGAILARRLLRGKHQQRPRWRLRLSTLMLLVIIAALVSYIVAELWHRQQAARRLEARSERAVAKFQQMQVQARQPKGTFEAGAEMQRPTGETPAAGQGGSLSHPTSRCTFPEVG